MPVLVILMLTSCSDDEEDDCTECGDGSQTSEDHVLNSFQVAWRQRVISKYTRLLAADYRYYPDPRTSAEIGKEFLTREEDSTRVACLFNNPVVKKISIELTWPTRSAQAAGLLPPRDTWTKLFLTDIFLDVDIEPIGSPVTTFRVEDQTQRFFFRRGRTNPPSGPADTLMYIVEWRDSGNSDFKLIASAGENSTWSSIKELVLCQ